MIRLLPPILTAVLFAVSFIAARYALRELTPLTTTLLRYVVALVFLATLAPRFGPATLRIERRDWLRVGALGLFGVVGYHYFFFTSLRYTDVAHTAIINSCTPLVTAAAAAILLRERLPRRAYAGVLTAFAGVLLLVTRGRLDNLLALRLQPGEGLMLLAVLSWVVYALLVKSLSGRYSGYALTFHSALGGVAVLALLTLGEPVARQIGAMSGRGIAAVAYMGVGASGLGYLLFNVGVRRLGPTRTSSVVASLVPPLVAVLGVTLLDEPVTTPMLVSMVVIVAGLQLLRGAVGD